MPKLKGKNLLIMVSDGTDYDDYAQLTKGFKAQGAIVHVSTPVAEQSIFTYEKGRRGRELSIDTPFDVIENLQFDGLVIPDGLLSTGELKNDARVMSLITEFFNRKKPIIVSGTAKELLYDTHVMPRGVMVRDTQDVGLLISQATDLLI